MNLSRVRRIAVVGGLFVALSGCSAGGSKDTSTESTTTGPSPATTTTVAGTTSSRPETGSTTVPTTTSSETTTTAAGVPTTAATPPPTAPPKGPGNVSDEPAGLFCRDLKAKGYSYSAAVTYWSDHGQTNQMDADKNGIPCETVYAPREVAAYWSGGSTVDWTPPRTVIDEPSGLFCRDLRARGFGFSEAVAYWYYYGQPDHMDADLNGIPCETVYPREDIAAYGW